MYSNMHDIWISVDNTLVQMYEKVPAAERFM